MPSKPTKEQKAIYNKTYVEKNRDKFNNYVKVYMKMNYDQDAKDKKRIYYLEKKLNPYHSVNVEFKKLCKISFD